MNPSDSTSCSRCGAPISGAATSRLCPACLESGNQVASDAQTVPVAMGQAQLPQEPREYPFEFGGYLLRGLLGRGGMAAVYEAEHLATGRRVALKMLSQQLDSADMRQRFLREGRLAASINHPHSLFVFGAEEIGGLPVITMEIAAAGTLQDELKKRGPLPVTVAVDAILDVISGLEAAYAGGVLHRDVKPSNCFVGPDGSVKVGDFGLSVSTLAKDGSYSTVSGVVMGTPAYASPEQLLGNELDVRADIYSVGATLFTLLTGRPPFEGENLLQVVVNSVNQKPRSLRKFREDLPPGLGRVIDTCLAKEPQSRYADYRALRNALLPFSSQEPVPASLKDRSAAGWVDYLIAFLVPYVILMLAVGQVEFHFRFIFERTLFSARYYGAFLGFGFLYFSLAEGIWGAGIGKRLKGLRVVRSQGRRPGIGRAAIRILLPVLSCEGVRIPLLMASISATHVDSLNWLEVAIFTGTAALCPWIPLLLTAGASRESGHATLWDRASGTRVVMSPTGTVRPRIEPPAQPAQGEGAVRLGPYQVRRELLAGSWLVATDPVLRRQVWLLRRTSSELALARRNLARAGRLRWLQKVEKGDGIWDAFEAMQGVPFLSLVAAGDWVPWGTLRHWLHDLASELFAATRDQTLPAELSLDQVWITASGQAVLLDEPWPAVEAPAERFAVGDVAGQHRFLHAVAAQVDSTSLPLHARSILQNLAAGKFERLGFLTGALRGLLDKPAEVSRGIRAGAIFLLPLYSWILFFVGIYVRR